MAERSTLNEGLRNKIVDREQVIAKLREHEPELKASGIARLSLFGSVARAASAIDLMAEFDPAKRFSLFRCLVFACGFRTPLGVPVDLAERRMLKDEVKARAEREAILVFKPYSQPLRDILDGVNMIEEFTAGMDFEAFRSKFCGGGCRGAELLTNGAAYFAD